MDQHNTQTRRGSKHEQQPHHTSTDDDPLQSFIAQKQPQAAAAKLLQRATSTRQQPPTAAAPSLPAAAASSAASPPQMPPHTDSPSLRLLKQQHLQSAAAVSAASSASSGCSEVWEEPSRPAARSSKRRRADDDFDYTEQASSHDAESEVRSDAEDASDADEDDGGATHKKGGTANKKAGANANLTSAEAKRRRRQQQNRDAAATSRNRKKAYLAGLESKVQSLESENSKLRAQLKAQKAMIESMRSQVQTRIHSAPAMQSTQHQPQPQQVVPKLVQVAAYQRDHARRVAAAVSAPATVAHPQAPLSPSDSFSSAPTSPRDQSGFERSSSAATQRASPVSTQFQQQRPAALHLQSTTAPCLDDELPALSSPAPMILHKQTSLEAVPHASTFLFPTESTTSSLLTQELHDSTQQHPLSMHPSQFYMDDASAPYGRVFEHDSHSSLFCASASASFLSVSSSPSPAVAALSPESQLITRVPAVERITESQHSDDHQQCVSIICLSTLMLWLQLAQGWMTSVNNSTSKSNKNSMQTTTTSSSSNTAAPSFSSKASRPSSDTFLERAARRTEPTLQALSGHSETTQARRTFMHIATYAHREAIACC